MTVSSLTAKMRPDIDTEPSITRKRRDAHETKVVIRVNGYPVTVTPDTFEPYPGGSLTLEVTVPDWRP